VNFTYVHRIKVNIGKQNLHSERLRGLKYFEEYHLLGCGAMYLVEVHQHFKGTHYLHLQGWRCGKQAVNKKQAAGWSACFLVIVVKTSNPTCQNFVLYGNSLYIGFNTRNVL
jgi:hypothetical protein